MHMHVLLLIWETLASWATAIHELFILFGCFYLIQSLGMCTILFLMGCLNDKSTSLLKALNNESDLETSQTPSTYARYCIKMHYGNTKIEWMKVQRKTSMIAWD